MVSQRAIEQANIVFIHVCGGVYQVKKDRTGTYRSKYLDDRAVSYELNECKVAILDKNENLIYKNFSIIGV